MPPEIKKAAITIDRLAEKWSISPDLSTMDRGFPEVIAELQEHLQRKGDEPGYGRVIFAIDGRDRYIELFDDDIKLVGVFTIISNGWRIPYGKDNEGIKKHLSDEIRDTLIVANNEAIAKVWETELKLLAYSTRRI